MQRIAITGLLACALVGCPPLKKLPPPPESGRCEFDVAASGLFSKIGKGSKAKVIETNAELVQGPAAQGAIGDYLLENDRIRVVIRRAVRSIEPLPFGGSIIDADLKVLGSTTNKDAFGNMAFVHNFARTTRPERIEVLSDGSEGGAAVIAVTGSDTFLDTSDALAALGVAVPDRTKLTFDPRAPVSLNITTYYVLSPGEARVRALTAICNTGKPQVVTPVGAIIHPSAAGALFNPLGCAKGLGAVGCNVDPTEWFGFQAAGIAYGVQPFVVSNDKAASVKSALSMMGGLVAVTTGAQDALGLSKWTDTTETAPGAIGIEAGQSRALLTDLYVGRDLAEVTSSKLSFEAGALSRVTIQTKETDGGAAPNVAVAISTAESATPVTLSVTGNDGSTTLDLRPGNYRATATIDGRAIQTPTTLTVPSNGTGMGTVTLGATRTLTVTFVDALDQPLSGGKVIVLCPGGPCRYDAAAYRRSSTVEDRPSTVQAIGFARSDGIAIVSVPPGAYEVMATFGPSYSAFPSTFPQTGAPVDLSSSDASLTVKLARVVDTTGWLSLDLHVHGAGSSDSAVPDALRAASISAEALGLAMITDHDRITTDAFEISTTTQGHANVFFAPATQGGAIDWAQADAGSLNWTELVDTVRSKWPESLLQLNHPRDGLIGAFSQLMIDTATGNTHADSTMLDANTTTTFEKRFDALEIMTGPTANRAVLNDWLTLLSRGVVMTATAGSDSHTAFTQTVGVARTWVQSVSTSATSVRSALKARHAFVSSGPFVAVTAQRLDSSQQPTGPSVAIGDTLSLTTGDSTIRLTVDVQSPQWMTFNTIEVLTHAAGREAVNGVPNTDWPDSRIAVKRQVSLTQEAVANTTARRNRAHETFDVPAPSSDSWYVVVVHGTSASSTIFPLAWGTVRCAQGLCAADSPPPEAITNPIFIDADGSGAYDTFPIKP